MGEPCGRLWLFRPKTCGYLTPMHEGEDTYFKNDPEISLCKSYLIS